MRGVACHRSVADIPQAVELAVVATPAPTVPGVIEECGRAGIRHAVVITAGFSEMGAQGAVLEGAVLEGAVLEGAVLEGALLEGALLEGALLEGALLEGALLESARRHGLRLIGPNCLGIMRSAIGLNATFARGNAAPGPLGMISQSGAICTAMLDWARPNGVGFSSVVSLGGSADIDFGEIIDYLVYDSSTEQILMYIEGIRDARRFMSAPCAAARVKPVIVMKGGRHPTGVRAAVSHTGAMVGADDVFDAAQALSSHVRPRGNRLAIVTNGGGPGVLAADRATDLGVPLAELSPQTIDGLKQALPANWSHGNPIDLIGDADAARYDAAVSACLADTQVDGVLAILTPQAMTSPTDVARAVVAATKDSTKPLHAAWKREEQVVAMTGDGVNDAPALNAADIGVAMGIAGTAVTREAATMVLTDDHFATIVRAVKEGRMIYDNIVKFVRFQLSTNIGAILTVLTATLLGWPTPFTAIHLLWINIIVDGPPAMTLGVEPERSGLMRDKPRLQSAQLLSVERLLRLALYGLILNVRG